MIGNSGRKCSGVTTMASGPVAMSFRGGTKGAYMHVSIPTLRSIMELRKSV